MLRTTRRTILRRFGALLIPMTGIALLAGTPTVPAHAQLGAGAPAAITLDDIVDDAALGAALGATLDALPSGEETLTQEEIDATLAGWTDQSRNSSVYADHTLRGVTAVDANHAWIVGGELDEDCVILRTTDGGEHWVREGCPRNKQMTVVHFHDRNVGWAAGRDGTMFKSTNGGDDWSRIDSGTGSTITAMHFVDESNGWTATRNSRIQRTVNGGGSWDQSTKVSEAGVLGIHFVDRNTGFVVGSEGLVMRSTDRGATWNKVDSGTDRRFHDVVFSDPKNGWIAGNDIRFSDNIGGSWRRVHNADKTIEALDVQSPGIVWAVGDEGLILRSTNNGASWDRRAVGLTERGMRDIVALSDGTVWAVGTGGRILKRNGDGGPAPTLPPVAPTERPAPTMPPPPTSTPLPTNTPRPTATPTVVPTRTPAGPWVAAEWSGGVAPIYVGAKGERLVEAVFGNMPASGVLSGTLTGPATFANGEQTFASNVFSRNGEGSFSMVLRTDGSASPGETFVLRLDLAGASDEREGMIAHQIVFGWLMKNLR